MTSPLFQTSPRPRRLYRSLARGLLALLVTAGAGCGSPNEAPSPNQAPSTDIDSGSDSGIRTGTNAGHHAPVILISVDTLRADRLPVYGYAGVETPAIDELASQAWRFDNAYTPVPLTLPAHSSVLTGTYPFQHGVRDNVGYRLDGQAHMTLPEHLRRAGYTTAAAVSAYVLRADSGFGAVFEHYDDGVDYGANRAMGDLQRSGLDTVAAATTWLDRYALSGRQEASSRHEASSPFLLFVHLFEPHTPYAPPPSFADRYADPYDGEIAAADAAIGRLVEALRARDLYDAAWIVFFSDHGEGLGDHGEAEHGIFLYRETLRVPLLIKPPASHRQAGAASISRPVSLIDILPTILDGLDLPAPDDLPGRSLLDLEASAADERSLYAESYYGRLHLGWSPLRSLVDDSYQYIEAPTPELYDLVADPAQRHNLLPGATGGQEVQLTGSPRRAFTQLRQTLRRDYPDTLTGPAAVSDEEAARFAALGYLAAPSSASDADLPDPKDVLPVLDELQTAFARAAAGDCSTSVQLLDGVLERFPTMFDAQVQRANCLQILGRHAEALAGFRTAVETSPNAAGSLLVEMAESLLTLERLDEARAHAEAAIDATPGPARALLARIAQQQGKPEEALAAARAAVEADAIPRPEAVLLLARLLIEAQRVPEALGHLDALQARVDQGRLEAVPGCQFLRADALARLQRSQQAEAAFLAEIQAFPKHSQAYANLAILYASQQRFAAIDPLLEAMVQAHPVAETYELAAATAERLGDVQGARRWRQASPPL